MNLSSNHILKKLYSESLKNRYYKISDIARGKMIPGGGNYKEYDHAFLCIEISEWSLQSDGEFFKKLQLVDPRREIISLPIHHSEIEHLFSDASKEKRIDKKMVTINKNGANFMDLTQRFLIQVMERYLKEGNLEPIKSNDFNKNSQLSEEPPYVFNSACLCLDTSNKKEYLVLIKAEIRGMTSVFRETVFDHYDEDKKMSVWLAIKNNLKEIDIPLIKKQVLYSTKDGRVFTGKFLDEK